MPGLGAMQGVSFHDDKVYLYGDVWDADPRVGVIRECTRDYEATGRVVWLRRDGKPLIRHPAGLTWHARWGTFLGDTVNRNALIPYAVSERARPRSPSRGFRSRQHPGTVQSAPPAASSCSCTICSATFSAKSSSNRTRAARVSVPAGVLHDSGG
jgi:hypothetical protein